MPHRAQSTLRAATFLICLAIPSLPSNSQSPASTAPTTCSVTKSPSPPFTPPKPYASTPGPDSFWFGTEKLWTCLPADATWRGLGHYTPGDPTYRQKLIFWSKGFKAQKEPQPNLVIIGKRLDASAPPLMSDRANAGWQDLHQPFIVTALNLPTLGCWQITARYKSANLTFVIRVTEPSPTLWGPRFSAPTR